MEPAEEKEKLESISFSAWLMNEKKMKFLFR
jgi:hypothetical protein